MHFVSLSFLSRSSDIPKQKVIWHSRGWHKACPTIRRIDGDLYVFRKLIQDLLTASIPFSIYFLSKTFLVLVLGEFIFRISFIIYVASFFPSTSSANFSSSISLIIVKMKKLFSPGFAGAFFRRGL